MATSTLQEHIAEAVQPVSQFWPMKGFVSHNPLQGLEHLPFDQAFRQARHLFGAEGYLPLAEYRALHGAGRIAARSIDRALARNGPNNGQSVTLGTRILSAAEVHRAHLLHGIDPLEPALFDWQINSCGALTRPRAGATEAVDVAALWQAALAVLNLKDPRQSPSDDRAADTAAEPSDNQAEDQAQDQTRETAPVDADAAIDLPFRRALSDWLDAETDSTVVASIDAQVIKWVSAFVDEGMAAWVMPLKRYGFFAAWRELVRLDASARLCGVEQFAERVAALPDAPEAAIRTCLELLEIPEPRWPDYLERVLAQLPGWTGLIRWRALNPDDPIQKINPIDVEQYLAVRMFYEAQFVTTEAKRQWAIAGTLPAIAERIAAQGSSAGTYVDANKQAVCRHAWRLFHLAQLLGIAADDLQSMRRDDANRILSWLDEFPAEAHNPVWLEAYEDSFRQELLSNIAGHRASAPAVAGRPLAQAAFCIDVRSEPFRRHFEAAGAFETFGYAGFFGIPIDHRSFDAEESFPLCPVLLTPSNALLELPREDQEQALASYATGSRWQQLADHLFHDLKHNPVAAFLLVDVVGLFFSAALLGKTLVRRPYNALVQTVKGWFARPVVTEIPVQPSSEQPEVSGLPIDLARGFSVEQQADFVEGGLRTIGLTSNFGRFIVLCGHGSTTDNNPYSAALDCGACGGRHGDPNARAFAAMGNSPAVRAELSKRGLELPEDTWFLPAKHDTTADRVHFYDLVDLPESHREDLEQLRQGFLVAGRNLALERCARIPGTPKGMTPEQAHAHVESRTFDWATTRPEWGLSGNAAFIIARRAVTRGLDIGGRCFLHSYDAASDPEGAILEKIMTAPLVVGEWINMQYYTSATDPWKYGSGSKVIHNVVAGIGVMYGSQSDLATGLPLQTVNDGEAHYHEPMRLLIIIEAEPAIVAGIISRHEILQQFFHNEWLNLVVLDRATFSFQRYNKDASWENVEL